MDKKEPIATFVLKVEFDEMPREYNELLTNLVDGAIAEGRVVEAEFVVTRGFKESFLPPR